MPECAPRDLLVRRMPPPHILNTYSTLCVRLLSVVPEEVNQQVLDEVDESAMLAAAPHLGEVRNCAAPGEHGHPRDGMGKPTNRACLGQRLGPRWPPGLRWPARGVAPRVCCVGDGGCAQPAAKAVK